MAGISHSTLDIETARGLKRGDPAAQSRAYQTLAPVVMGTALRILQDKSLAEEVVQDTFVSLIERASTLRDAQAVVGWVRQTAVNHCLMRLRSPWHSRRLGGEPLEEVDVSQAPQRTDDLLDLERSLSLLGPDTRTVLWLHDVEGYTHQEIGALVGKTASYSKSQLSRGYQKLLDVYGGEEDDGIARANDIEPACVS